MNGSSDHHPELDPALRALGERLAGLGRAHAAERPGLADRVFAASRAELRGGAVVGRVGFASAVVRRWSFAAAAAVLLAASVAVYMRALPATKGPAGDIAAARSAVLGPASGSESLLVALIDQEAALDDDGMDAASAIALAHRGSADLVAVELDELLATGGRR
jgi:hypothetical protein